MLLLAVSATISESSYYSGRPNESTLQTITTSYYTHTAELVLNKPFIYLPLLHLRPFFSILSLSLSSSSSIVLVLKLALITFNSIHASPTNNDTTSISPQTNHSLRSFIHSTVLPFLLLLLPRWSQSACRSLCPHRTNHHHHHPSSQQHFSCRCRLVHPILAAPVLVVVVVVPPSIASPYKARCAPRIFQLFGAAKFHLRSHLVSGLATTNSLPVLFIHGLNV